MYPGSAPARLYGTPKMHNALHSFSSDSFPKLRPTVSSIGTFNYNLANFLCDLSNGYSCKDTFSFASHINNANLYKKFLFPTM